MDQLRQHPLALMLVVGMISATGFAPLDLWPLLLGSLALWLWAVHEATSLRSAMLRSWVFGVGHFTLGDNWIQHAFDYQDKMPPALGYFAVVLLALYLAVYPAIAGGLAWKYGHRDGAPDGRFVLIAGAAWIVTEWMRASLFTGYAWNPLAVSWIPVIGVARIASWIGTYALSGVTVVVAGCILMLFYRRWRLAAGVGTLLLIAAASPLWHHSPGTDDSKLVRIIQPNVGQDAVGRKDYAEYVFSTMLSLSGEPGPKPRLIVWPEGLVPYYLENGYPNDWYYQSRPEITRARIAAHLGPKDVAMVGGNALFFTNGDDKLDGAGNSVFVVNPDGSLGPKRYDKAHLVPYGEYLPMRSILQPLGLSRLVMGDVDFWPGPGPQSLNVPGFAKVGVQICYEIIFSGQVVNEADRPHLLFNPSNDAWFGKWGPPEHLAQARLRAIEEGVPILRSTPTGISALIAADGALLGHIDSGKAGALQLPMPKPFAPTLFSRLGNVAAFLVAAFFVLGAVAFRRVRG